MLSRSPLPPGLGVEIDRAVRLSDEGHVLVGGNPPRAVRLSPSQVSALIRWLSRAVPRGGEESRFARDLVRAGLAHPRPLPLVPGDTVEVAVVGPAGPGGLGAAFGVWRPSAAPPDGPGALAATLDHLAEHHPELRPVVVGADGPDAWVARRRGARVVPGPAGGAAARAEALRVCSAEFVALVEAGTRPAPGWLENALGHFADPDVAAVVPRVLADRSACLGHTQMVVAAVAARHAGPDRGADPAPVLPWGHAVPGQERPGPTNEHTDPLRPLPVLVLRRALADPDPGLGAAAELDLLWRLVEEGHTVRYEPRSRVWAPPTTDLGGYLRACFTAGAVAGPLARRRGEREAGPEMSWAGAAGLSLVALGRPDAALLAGALGGAAVAGTLAARARIPLPEAARLAGLDLARTVREGTRAVRTAWWPLAAATVVGGAVSRRRGRGGLGGGSRVPAGPVRGAGGVSPSEARWRATAGRAALAAGAALVLPHVAAWHRGRGVALAGPVSWTALGMAGDAARSLGSWWGMARSGSVAPLVPRLGSLAAVGTVTRERAGRVRGVRGTEEGAAVTVDRS